MLPFGMDDPVFHLGPLPAEDPFPMGGDLDQIVGVDVGVRRVGVRIDDLFEPLRRCGRRPGLA